MCRRISCLWNVYMSLQIRPKPNRNVCQPIDCPWKRPPQVMAHTHTSVPAQTCGDLQPSVLHLLWCTQMWTIPSTTSCRCDRMPTPIRCPRRMCPQSMCQRCQRPTSRHERSAFSPRSAIALHRIVRLYKHTHTHRRFCCAESWSRFRTCPTATREPHIFRLGHDDRRKRMRSCVCVYVYRLPAFSRRVIQINVKSIWIVGGLHTHTHPKDSPYTIPITRTMLASDTVRW